MNKSKLNYKVFNGKFIKELLENSRIIILSIIFLIGIIIGAIIINRHYETSEKITDYINNGILLKTGQGISEIFINSVISSCIFFAINIFFAFSLIGYPFIILIPFLKGLGFGVICGYIYLIYGFAGFGYCFLTLFPGATVSTFALISACNTSCEYSKNAYLIERNKTKYYLLKQLIFICICVFSSLIDSVLSILFIRFFEF